MRQQKTKKNTINLKGKCRDIKKLVLWLSKKFNKFI